MAGFSLTLVKVDDQLKDLFMAPAEIAARVFWRYCDLDFSPLSDTAHTESLVRVVFVLCAQKAECGAASIPSRLINHRLRLRLLRLPLALSDGTPCS